MKTTHSSLRNGGLVAMSLGLLLASSAALAARPGQTPAPVTVVTTPVDYEKLSGLVGAELLIHTTFNTVRRGVLVKATAYNLTLNVGPEGGAIELLVPRDTVRSIGLVALESQAPFAESTENTHPGNRARAEKN